MKHYPNHNNTYDEVWDDFVVNFDTLTIPIKSVIKMSEPMQRENDSIKAYEKWLKKVSHKLEELLTKK